MGLRCCIALGVSRWLYRLGRVSLLCLYLLRGPHQLRLAAVVYGKGGCWGTPCRGPPPPSFPRPAPRPSQLLPPATSLPASPPVQNPHSLSGHHPQAARPPRPIRTSYPHRLTLSAPPQHLQSTSSTPTQAPTPTLPPRPIRTSSPLFPAPLSAPLAARPARSAPYPPTRGKKRKGTIGYWLYHVAETQPPAR